VQVQEEIGQHHDDAIAPVDRHRMPKDAFPNLGFSNDFANAGHNTQPQVNVSRKGLRRAQPSGANAQR
jgi:hypothetical protein